MQIQFSHDEVVAAIRAKAAQDGINIAGRDVEFSVKRDKSIVATLSEPEAVTTVTDAE